jgi:predicted Holliday junction resolvase-like endonuclease
VTTALLVVLAILVLCVVNLILRVRGLENAVTTLARIVDKPRRRDRAIRKEIRELEEELEEMRENAAEGLVDPDEFDRADVIREKLDRRLRALAGRRGTPPESPIARRG